MRIITIAHPAWRMPLLLACILLATSGCSRTKYRLQADREAQLWAEAGYGPEYG
mgnify:CR=1 FL=1